MSHSRSYHVIILSISGGNSHHSCCWHVRTTQVRQVVKICHQQICHRISTTHGYGSNCMLLGRSWYAITLLVSGGDSHHSRCRPCQTNRGSQPLLAMAATACHTAVLIMRSFFWFRFLVAIATIRVADMSNHTSPTSWELDEHLFLKREILVGRCFVFF